MVSERLSVTRAGPGSTGPHCMCTDKTPLRAPLRRSCPTNTTKTHTGVGFEIQERTAPHAVSQTPAKQAHMEPVQLVSVHSYPQPPAVGSRQVEAEAFSTSGWAAPFAMKVAGMSAIASGMGILTRRQGVQVAAVPVGGRGPAHGFSGHGRARLRGRLRTRHARRAIQAQRMAASGLGTRLACAVAYITPLCLT